MNLRRSHPNLFKLYLVYALTCIALGVNFLFSTPAFDPIGISKQIPGVVFLALGLAQLVYLTVFRSAVGLRAVMALIIAAMFFWCGVLVADFFRLHQTSLQLPIVYLALGALGYPLMAEPPTNPTTSLKRGGEA